MRQSPDQILRFFLAVTGGGDYTHFPKQEQIIIGIIIAIVIIIIVTIFPSTIIIGFYLFS